MFYGLENKFQAEEALLFDGSEEMMGIQSLSDATVHSTESVNSCNKRKRTSTPPTLPGFDQPMSGGDDVSVAESVNSGEAPIPSANNDFLQGLRPADRRAMLALHYSFCGEMKKPENQGIGLLSQTKDPVVVNSSNMSICPIAGVPLMVGALGNYPSENSGRTLTLPGGKILPLGKISNGRRRRRKVDDNTDCQSHIAVDDDLSLIVVKESLSITQSSSASSAHISRKSGKQSNIKHLTEKQR